MAATGLTRLRIDDEAFVVASLIERCPKAMMLRELVQNAIDCAQLAPPGQRRVDIMPGRVGAVRKLAIRNTGPGMDAGELYRMCDIAASIGKEKGLDRNFGMGAKVASLPSNRLGMRYRSCAAGRVHEVVIGKRGGVYGRIRRTDPLTRRAIDVADVTGEAMAEGLPLGEDWTEVVLLGDRAEQDTFAEPYDGEPAMEAGWIADGLAHRFYRLPPDVEVLMHDAAHGGPRATAFRPVGAGIADFPRTETVTLPDGARIHYLFDPQQGAASTGAIVFRDEMYDVRRSWMWSQIGPQFGLSFGVQHVWIHVELPAAAPVQVDAYRQFLRHAGGAQTPIELTDYAALVAAHRPGWLLAELRALGPDTRIAASLRDELSSLLKGLGVRRVQRGARQPDSAAASFAAEVEVTHPMLRPGLREPTESLLDAGREPEHEHAPEIVLLRDLRHVHDRLLDGRAASYDPVSHELFVNMRYAAFEAMAGELAAELASAHAGSAEPAALTRAATEAAEETLVRRIGRTLVHGLAKREATPAWNRWHLQAAICPEALTLAADDFVWSMADARIHAAHAISEAA